MSDLDNLTYAEAIEELNQMKGGIGWRLLERDLTRRMNKARETLPKMVEAQRAETLAFAAHINAMELMAVHPDTMIAQYEEEIRKQKEAQEDAGDGFTPDDHTAL